MDSIGDYIYLIVVLVAAISGILKKKKKKEQEEKRYFPDEMPDLEDVIPEYTGKEPVFTIPEVRQVPKEVYKPVKQANEKGVDNLEGYENTTDINKIRAKKNVQPVKVSLKTEFQEMEVEQESEFSLSCQDDARRAFIYTEILTKKY